MKRLFLLLCGLAVLYGFNACSSCKKNKKAVEEEIVDDIKASYKMLPGEQQEIIDIIYQWNAVHDSVRIDSLEKFYNDPVLFFKNRISRRSVYEAKRYKIKKADIYRERIIGRIGIYASDTGDYKCEFLKLVNIDNKPRVYHSYLIVKKFADSTWRIIVESDKEADSKPPMVDLFERFEESEDLSSGDFNGDGTKEELIVIKPPGDSSGFANPSTKISFTNFDLPEITLTNCIGVNVLNENDVDGDGADDFSVVIKSPQGDIGDVLLYSFKRGKWVVLAKFKAHPDEVFRQRQQLIEFAGNGNIHTRVLDKTPDNRDTVIIQTISTW